MAVIPYKCTKCGAEGVKLWREYNTCASITDLYCAACACKNQKKKNNVDAKGYRTASDGDKTDQIGWLVPACPTSDSETFWGYTSVPMDIVNWWRGLPVKAGA